MGVLGMQWNILIIITHTLNRPFFMLVTAGQLTSQLSFFTVRLHDHNTIKVPSLNE